MDTDYLNSVTCPVTFTETYCKIKLYDHQKEAMKENFLIAETDRVVGFSTAANLHILHQICFSCDETIVIYSPNLELGKLSLDFIVNEFQSLNGVIPLPNMVVRNKCMITFDNGVRVMVKSDPNNLRGLCVDKFYINDITLHKNIEECLHVLLPSYAMSSKKSLMWIWGEHIPEIVYETFSHDKFKKMKIRMLT